MFTSIRDACTRLQNSYVTSTSVETTSYKLIPNGNDVSKQNTLTSMLLMSVDYRHLLRLTSRRRQRCIDSSSNNNNINNQYFGIRSTAVYKDLSVPKDDDDDDNVDTANEKNIQHYRVARALKVAAPKDVDRIVRSKLYVDVENFIDLTATEINDRDKVENVAYNIVDANLTTSRRNAENYLKLLFFSTPSEATTQRQQRQERQNENHIFWISFDVSYGRTLTFPSQRCARTYDEFSVKRLSRDDVSSVLTRYWDIIRCVHEVLSKMPHFENLNDINVNDNENRNDVEFRRSSVNEYGTANFLFVIQILCVRISVLNFTYTATFNVVATRRSSCENREPTNVDLARANCYHYQRHHHQTSSSTSKDSLSDVEYSLEINLMYVSGNNNDDVDNVDEVVGISECVFLQQLLEYSIIANFLGFCCADKLPIKHSRVRCLFTRRFRVLDEDNGTVITTDQFDKFSFTRRVCEHQRYLLFFYNTNDRSINFSVKKPDDAQSESSSWWYYWSSPQFWFHQRSRQKRNNDDAEEPCIDNCGSEDEATKIFLRNIDIIVV
ncbi:hypothetical protein HT594_00113 [Phenacoccus solenopsis nudivirus]|nr:hypothetical protein HT594_00113 [Phenacoccus solenopsis nudivirus]